MSWSTDERSDDTIAVTDEMEHFKQRIHQLEHELNIVRADYRALLEKHQQLISDNGWCGTKKDTY